MTIAFTAISPVLILWVNFVSAVGFQAIISQVTLSLTTTYIMAIGCSLYSRYRNPDLLGREWRGIFQLGTFWGKINDIIALVFLVYAWTLSLYEICYSVSAQDISDCSQVSIHDACERSNTELCPCHRRWNRLSEHCVLLHLCSEALSHSSATRYHESCGVEQFCA